MKKAAILLAFLTAAAWTCAPETGPVPAPGGGYTIEAWAFTARAGTASASVWAGPEIGIGGDHFQVMAVTVWPDQNPGPEYAAGRYYTDTGEIEITWTGAQGLDWLTFTGAVQPGLDIAGQLSGTYQGHNLTLIISAEPNQ